MEKEKLRIVPIKNYLILGIILLVTGLLLFYFYSWFDKYEESKLNRPILNRYMTVINTNELDNYLVENPNANVYVSILNDEKIREFEKSIKKSYRDDLIDTNILYMDVTNISKSDKLYMEENYYLNNYSILDIPCVISFYNSKVMSIYSISDNGYDIDNFVRYVNQLEEYND